MAQASRHRQITTNLRILVDKQGVREMIPTKSTPAPANEPSDDWEERFEHYDEAVDDMVEHRVHQCLSSSIPHDAKLVNWLGGYDYFQEWEVSWRETFCFAGDACHCPGDIAETMRTRIPSYVATEEEITEEVVEDFFVEWRAHLFHRVAKEAAKLS